MVTTERCDLAEGDTACDVIENLTQTAKRPSLSTVARAIRLVAAHLDEGLLGGRQGDGW